MIRIAIVDDECYLCSYIEKVLLAYNRVSTYDFNIEVFKSGEDMFQYIDKFQNFDLIFLDIEMEGFNGVEIGKIIRGHYRNNITQIVYITACEGYERQLFQVRPMDFLEKPLTNSVIVETVEKYIRLYANMEQLFAFTYHRKQMKVPYKEIVYFKSDDKKIEMYMEDKSYCFYGKLNDIVSRLPCEFIIIHKSYIVNRMYIKKYGYDCVTMINHQELPISQNYRKDVRKLLSSKSNSGKEFFYV
jgi:DNA-binding LytR/AlgR family response regulator